MRSNEIIQKYGIEYLGRFYSKYRGIVVENKDPKKMGRLKVYLPSILGGITLWAKPISIGGGSGMGFKFLTPNEASIVYIEFENGDPMHPLWGYHGWAVSEMPEELSEDVLGVITPNGNKIILREKEGQIFIETKGDIDIKSDGVIKSEGKEIHLQEGEVGIPQTTDLVERLNLIEKKLNSYITTMKNSPPITPSDGGKAFKTWMVNQVGEVLSLTKETDIASETIKQPR